MEYFEQLRKEPGKKGGNIRANYPTITRPVFRESERTKSRLWNGVDVGALWHLHPHRSNPWTPRPAQGGWRETSKSNLRIGEASNPGPEAEVQQLKLRSMNITSATSSETTILDQDADIIFLQEHSVGGASLPDAEPQPNSKLGNALLDP